MRRSTTDTGMALLTTMMVMLLLSSLLVGFGVMVVSDNQLSAGDLGRTEAFYAAQAGLEKLTSDLGALFVATPNPTGNDIRALLASPPLLPNIDYEKPDGTPGYEILFPSTAGDPGAGDPITVELTVASGPFAGLVGQITPYTLTVTARRSEGAEASLERLIQTVSMPIFEFGIFATQDISVFPDQAFTVGGMVHTNFNLDGGVQNLMRLLEDWSGDTLYYRGSLAPLWASRQARGSFKCCTNVFVPPTTLAFEHDTDFLDMSLVPPGTPRISDVNITGFRQILQTR